jgi:hypothetical protein
LLALVSYETDEEQLKVLIYVRNVK